MGGSLRAISPSTIVLLSAAEVLLGRLPKVICQDIIMSCLFIGTAQQWHFGN